MGKFNESTTILKEILEDAEMLAIVNKYIPNIENNPMLGIVKGKTIPQLRALIPDAKMNEAIDKAVEELKTI